MNRYYVRDLLQYNLDELYQVLSAGDSKKAEIVFDDGKSIIATRASTVYSRALWELYRLLPQTPITVDTHHGAQPMTPNIQMKGLDRVCQHIVTYAQANGLMSYELVAELGKLAWEVQSTLYNFSYTHLQRYATGVSATDLVEILSHPSIEAINASVEANPQSIKRAQDRIRAIVKDPEEFGDNNMCVMMRAETINIVQAGQMFSPIGYRIDVDYTILPKPIVRCFGEGLHEVVDVLMESRAATDSMASNGPPLQQAQKFYRMMTLVSSLVDKVEQGVDCGSKFTIPFNVTTTNLVALDGMYHVVDGVVTRLSPKDKHLIGTTIQLRSVMGCALPNRSHVCSTCHGELSWTVPPATSVGALSSIECGWSTGQTIMGKKHVAGSSMADALKIRKEDSNYIEEGSDETAIRLREWMSSQNFKLCVNKPFIEMMTMIQPGVSLSEINIGKFSSIRDVQLVDDQGHVYNIITSMGGRWGQFTPEFIEYLIAYGYTPNATQYIIDLSQWDHELDIIRLPSKQTDIYEFKKEFSRIFSATDRKRSKRYPATPESLGELLEEFVELARSKFPIHLSHLMMLLYTTMSVNPSQGNYDLPREHDTRYFDVFFSNIKNRSLGHFCAYQQQVDVLMGMSHYGRAHPRMYSRFDYFLDLRLRRKE